MRTATTPDCAPTSGSGCSRLSVFFTFAGNILFTYVLPGLPAFALLVARAWDGLAETTPWRRSVKYHPLLIPVGTVFAVLLVVPRLAPSYTQRDLVQRYFAARGAASERLVYYGETPHSAEFYARGKIDLARSSADLSLHLQEPGRAFFVAQGIAARGAARAAGAHDCRSRAPRRYLLLAKR